MASMPLAAVSAFGMFIMRSVSIMAIFGKSSQSARGYLAPLLSSVMTAKGVTSVPVPADVESQ